ncbi:MAG: hypothetical protein DCF30_22835 [Hyphomicrobiales bacterium]|nr:MAG: hypothetical protein DCF30_22835 [Hyphomicrobiales bacterium]
MESKEQESKKAAALRATVAMRVAPPERLERERTRPFAIRLTEAERSRLVAETGKRTLGEYVRMRLFNSESRPRRVQMPTVSARDLAHVLAALGQSDLAPMLREMLKAARVGALPVTQETETAIRSACAAVLDIRQRLMVALGLIEGHGDDP